MKRRSRAQSKKKVAARKSRATVQTSRAPRAPQRPQGLLGRFLLQSLTRKTPVQAPLKKKRKSNPAPRTALHLFAWARTQTQSPPEPKAQSKPQSMREAKVLAHDPSQEPTQAQAAIASTTLPSTLPSAIPPGIPSGPFAPSSDLALLSGPSPSLLTTQLLRPHEELKQSIEGFLLDQRSPHTRRAYGKDLKRFIQFLILRQQEHGIQRIDRLLIIAYKDSLLNEGLEHTTVDRHLATLRSFFRWLVDDGKIEKSPVEGVRFLNPKRMSSTLGFTDEEVRRVLAIPDRHTRTGAMHHAILSVLFYCGLRRSELCSLRTSHIGNERNHPVLRLRGKGNAERLIVIPPKAWDSLNHYLAITRKIMREDQFLFNPIRNNRGGSDLNKGLDPSMIFYIVTKYSKIAGIANRVSPHSCRATAISNARDHQVSDRAIQEFAGWASPDMITRYDKRRNAIENSASLAIQYEPDQKEEPLE